LKPLRTGQENGEATTLSLAGLGRDPPSVSFGDAAHDRETKTRAAALPMRLTVRVEDVWQRFGGNADSGVFHLKLELRPRVDDACDDAATRRSESDRVGAQVHEHLMEPLDVTAICEVRADVLAFQRHGGLRRQGVQLLDRPFDHLREIE